jgi:hypothetical protein
LQVCCAQTPLQQSVYEAQPPPPITHWPGMQRSAPLQEYAPAQEFGSQTQLPFS